MMGYQPGLQPKLFYHQIRLDQKVPKDHLLRKIQEEIDFDFIYGEVKDTHGDNGNVSIPPPEKEASGSGLGYWDLVSSIKKLTQSTNQSA